MKRPEVADVVLPLPVNQSYTYHIPPSLEDRVVPGARVVVPVRGRRAIGLVMRCGDADVRALKPIVAAPDAEPAASGVLMELARWMAAYYGAPLGLAVRTLLPGALAIATLPAR